MRASPSSRPNTSTVRGPTSRPIWSSGIASAGDDVVVSASALNSGGADDVDRQHDPVAGLGEQPAAGVDLVGLEQRLPDAVALGGEEREAHAAADEQPVDLGQQRLDHGQLVADLRAAEHDHVGPLRVGGQPGEHVELAGDQPAGVVRQPLGDVEDRGVLAVHRAERVVDVDVGEGGQPVGQLAALGVVLATSRRPRSGRSPAAARRRRPRAGGLGAWRPRPATSAASGTVGAEQLAEARRHRGERVLRVGRALGPAEVGGHDRPGRRPSRSACRVGRLARIRPSSVIAPVALVQRDVQVGAQQHAPTRDALGEEVVDGAHRELRADQGDEVDEAVRVAPLVVVPAEHLGHRAEDLGQLRVVDAGRRVGDDVGGDDRRVGVGQVLAERAGRGLAVGGVDLVGRRLAVQLDGEVGGRAGGHRDADRVAVELALELGQDQADRLRGAGRGRAPC